MNRCLLVVLVGVLGAGGCDGSSSGEDAGWDDGADASDSGADSADELSDDGDAQIDAGEGDAADGDAADGGDGADVLFDLSAIRDPATAQCTLSNPRTLLQGAVLVDLWDLSFVSWESLDGTLRPILIRAFAARPAGVSGALPGVVLAHGLGGFAEPEDAAGLAALLGVAAVAYSGPGSGDAADNTSEGLGPTDGDGYRLFDTLLDLRGSWFWAHAVAGMRALTCLENMPEVDRDRLGMTGFSAGAVVTLLSAGVDDRIRAAVPLSGTGAWEVATRSPQAWQHDLLAAAGLSVESEEWLRLMQALIAPAVMVGQGRAAILMVNGTTDEFFPLTAHLATYDAIPGADKRTSLIGNFDHGCYSVTGVEDAQVIEDRARLHQEGALRLWFGHYFGSADAYAVVPQPPTLSVESGSPLSIVLALVDESPAGLAVEEVTFWWSQDDAWSFWDQTLERSGGFWQASVPMTLQPNSVYFLDVQYRTPDPIAPERFTISSPPVVPPDLIPRIRAIGTCQ
jgi:dienelactone hydrolase